MLAQIKKLNIGPSRSILKKDTLAECYANCDVFANIDEEFPAAVQGVKFTIDTTDEHLGRNVIVPLLNTRGRSWMRSYEFSREKA